MARFALLVLALTGAAAPQPPKNDYADPLSWLCKPGRQDACAVDLTTTVVAADGTTTVETWAPNPRADDIAEDVITNGQANASWGLHLIDVQVALGNLVEIVGQQGRAYLATHSR